MEPTVLKIWMRPYIGPKDTSERKTKSVAGERTEDAPADTQAQTTTTP